MYSNMVMANLCQRESDNLNSVLILFTWIQAILALYMDEHESMKRKNAKLRTLPSCQQQHQTSTCNSGVSSHGGQSTLDIGEIFPMRDNRTGSAASSNSTLANAISTYEGHIPRDIKGSNNSSGSEGHHGRGVDRNSSDSTLSLHLQHLERVNGFKNSQAAVYGHPHQQPHYQQQQSRFQQHAVTVSTSEPSYIQANRNEAGAGRSKNRISLSSGPTLHASRNQDQFADFWRSHTHRNVRDVFALLINWKKKQIIDQFLWFLKNVSSTASLFCCILNNLYINISWKKTICVAGGQAWTHHFSAEAMSRSSPAKRAHIELSTAALTTPTDFKKVTPKILSMHNHKTMLLFHV